MIHTYRCGGKIQSFMANEKPFNLVLSSSTLGKETLLLHNKQRMRLEILFSISLTNAWAVSFLQNLIWLHCMNHPLLNSTIPSSLTSPMSGNMPRMHTIAMFQSRTHSMSCNLGTKFTQAVK